MQRIAKLGIIGTSAAVLFGAMSGVSFADATRSCDASWDDNGVNCTIRHYVNGNTGDLASKGSFTSYGEIVAASDHYTDGMGVYIKAEDDLGLTYVEEWVTGGKGDSVSVNASFLEGHPIDLTVCQTDNGRKLNCLTADATA
ncbi:hypothetical protein QFZ24_010048 [Streptomyces phaeochromogenes]|uniref:hypothetical protein n=1 Tax=Streptomyces phaeochromogenes TaxID=1923 RepID=UPI002790C151|nr:hypothetical protein [Streptomyces phaeochromogenes]MDQ0956039.1 hypothetical protein [Streptomyces phaeochromogenes]